VFSGGCVVPVQPLQLAYHQKDAVLSRSRVKVGFLSPRLRLAGAERWMIQLARYCDPNRIEWTGMALMEWSTEDQAITTEMSRVLPIIYGPPIRGDPRNHALQHIVRSSVDATLGISEICGLSDIVLTWDANLLPVMTSSYIERGLKVVLVSHSDGPHGANVGMEPGATHFVGVSKESLNVFSEAAKAKATIIYNGGEIDRCCPIRGREAMRKIYGLNDNHFVVGYIGRFSEEKNPLASAYALRDMGAEPRYYAVFVGPDEMQCFHSKVEQILPRDRFVICPSVQHVGDFLAMFDCMMVASYTEAFSLRIVEAWLAGVPVIATPIGHLPEMTSLHGQLFFPVPFRHSPRDLSMAVKDVEIHIEKTAEIVERARKVAWEHYTAPACAHRWTEYLCSLGKRS